LIEVSLGRDTLPEAGALILPIAPDGRPADAGRALAERAGDLLERAVRTHATAEGGRLRHGDIVDLLLPAGLGLDHLILVAVGKPEGVSRLELEELGGKLATRLTGLSLAQACLAPLDGLETGHPPMAATMAVALGAKLRSYRFDKYRRPEEDEDREPKLAGLEVLKSADWDDAEAKVALEALDIQAAAVARTRDLVSEPANTLDPESFAERCRELEALGIEVEILDQAALEEIGMGALLAVAQGSAKKPYVAIMRWQGAGNAPPLALVGKGVCFDSGGISIKPAAGMEEMKWDMGGAGIVVGAMHALAGRKAPVNVVGIIGLVENMPSGTATRPGDVVRTLSGQTVEVINTDAEGRLVLADLLWYTKERFQPRAMIDLATLTGAVIVALGHENAGFFTPDDELAAKLTQAGEKVGDTVWRLPLGKNYAKHIKSQIADIKNVGRGREAGATAGAVFLERFKGDVPWAHLDVAGVVWSSRDLPLAAKGATGFGVRLLDELIRDGFEG